MGTLTKIDPQAPKLTEREPWSRDVVKQIATDIGKDTVAYIEVMYPKAIEATSSSFKLSVRNHIHNQVMSAIELPTEDAVSDWLASRKKHRREWLATYREIRERDKAEPISKAQEIRDLAERVRLLNTNWVPASGYVLDLKVSPSEAETIQKALLLLAEIEDNTIDLEPVKTNE